MEPDTLPNEAAAKAIVPKAAKRRAKAAAKKTAKPKAKARPKTKTKPKAKKSAKKAVKKSKPKKTAKRKAKKSGTVERSERLDMRLTKAEKGKVLAKAAKLRRTVTSIVIEAIEKLR